MFQKCPLCNGDHYGVRCTVCNGHKIIHTVTGFPPAGPSPLDPDTVLKQLGQDPKETARRKLEENK